MYEIVIVPAWRRADFLYACLSRLQIADTGDQDIWVSLDRGYSNDVYQVALYFRDVFGSYRYLVKCRKHGYRGNSYNVLTSYQEACKESPDLIHLIEDDIFVGSDYFDFHQQAHALCSDVFAVSACRNQNHPFPVEQQPESHEDMVYCHYSYQSLAVSFRPDQLSRVLPHVKIEYFDDMVGYCTRVFPQSKLKAAWSEQDGLLHRIVEQGRLQTAYGAVPRAYHAGFVGYNRQGNALARGVVEDRAYALLRMSSDELNARAISIKDHDAIDLDASRAQLSRVLEGWP